MREQPGSREKRTPSFITGAKAEHVGSLAGNCSGGDLCNCSGT